MSTRKGSCSGVMRSGDEGSDRRRMGDAHPRRAGTGGTLGAGEERGRGGLGFGK
jgi:hypothetical protein